MIKMLNELNLPTLQSRRQKQRLIFFYKGVEGQVPAMPLEQFVKYQKSKRQNRASKIANCVTNNIVTSSVRNNSKCIVIPPSRTDQYKYSFFVQKAFDCLPHDILICKLSSYGLSENDCTLLLSYGYLSCRKQQIQIGGTVSSWADIQKRCSLRIHLGPFTFSCFHK
jgi:hypothetical protein